MLARSRGAGAAEETPTSTAMLPIESQGSGIYPICVCIRTRTVSTARIKRSTLDLAITQHATASSPSAHHSPETVIVRKAKRLSTSAVTKTGNVECTAEHHILSTGSCDGKDNRQR